MLKYTHVKFMHSEDLMEFKIYKNLFKIKTRSRDETLLLKTCGSVLWVKKGAYFLASFQVSFIKNFIITFNLYHHTELNTLLASRIDEYRHNNKVMRVCDYYRKNQSISTPIDAYGDFAKGMRHAQKNSLYGSLCIDRFGLFLDRGVGKTKICIDNFTIRMLNNQVKKILVVCPKLNIANTWVPEIEKHCKLKIPVIPIVGSSKQKIALFRNESREYYVHIITYASMRLYIEKMSAYDMVIFDESRDLGDYSSQQSEAAFTLSANAKYVIAATGTVNTLKNMKDVFSQYKVLDLGTSFGLNYNSFLEKYFRDVGEDYPSWVIKKGSQDEVNRLMYSRAISYTKEEALDLPERFVKFIDIVPSKFQRHFTDAFADGLSLVFPDAQLKTLFEKEGVPYNKEAAAINGAIPISRVTKLQEITSGFYKFYSVKNKYARFKSSKMLYLLDLLHKIGDKKLIIWCRFIEDIKAISRLLKSEGKGSYLMYGEKDEIKKWQTDPNVNVLIGMESVGKGTTLIEAEYMIYYSYDYGLQDFLQSIDRNYRMGQDKDVGVYVLKQKNTVDQVVVDSLRTNFRFSRKLTSHQLKKIAKGKIF